MTPPSVERPVASAAARNYLDQKRKPPNSGIEERREETVGDIHPLSGERLVTLDVCQVFDKQCPGSRGKERREDITTV